MRDSPRPGVSVSLGHLGVLVEMWPLAWGRRGRNDPLRAFLRKARAFEWVQDGTLPSHCQLSARRPNE